jgi:hypothetical protein
MAEDTPRTGRAFLGLLQQRVPVLLAGAALSAGLTAGFNFYRFGVFYNALYLNPILLVTDPGIRLSYFLGLWLSPAGGLLFFWPSLVLLLVFALRRATLPVWGLVVFLGAMTVGLSKWFAPFGWVAWGPRLLLPWLPAVLVLFLIAVPDLSKTIGRTLFSSRRRSIVSSLLLLVISFPQFAFLYAGEYVKGILVGPPGCETANILTDVAHYYRCIHHVLWHNFFSFRELILPAIRPPATVFAIAYCGFILSACGLFRKMVAPEDGDHQTPTSRQEEGL